MKEKGTMEERKMSVVHILLDPQWFHVSLCLVVERDLVFTEFDVCYEFTWWQIFDLWLMIVV